MEQGDSINRPPAWLGLNPNEVSFDDSISSNENHYLEADLDKMNEFEKLRIDQRSQIM